MEKTTMHVNLSFALVKERTGTRRGRCHRSRRLARVFANTSLLALLVGGALSRATAQTYAVTDLGGLGGNTYAAGINASGQVAGYAFGTKGPANAFRSRSIASFQDLGLLPGAQNGSYAFAINDSAQVAGMVDISGGDGIYGAIRFDGNTVVDLGTLPGYAGSWSEAINSSGQVAGFAQGATSNRAIRFTNGLVEDLGSLGGPDYADGINDVGDVVGVSRLNNNPVTDPWLGIGHAFVYPNSFPIMIDLNATLSAAQKAQWLLVTASAINNADQIVGYGSHTGVGTHAYLYQQGVVTDLGTFPNGGISYANAINDKGVVVGAAYLDASGNGNNRAMIWDPVHGMRNLNNLLPAGSGWILTEATGINNAGQICAYGTNTATGNRLRAVILTP